MRQYRLIHGRPAWRTFVALAATAALAFVVAAPSNAAAPQYTGASWTQPNGDAQGTRHVGGPIGSWSVGQLSPVWTAPMVGNVNRFSGAYASTPVVVDGVVYTQDLDSNVYAIDLHTGRTLWTTRYDDPSNGPNGVAVADGMVYGTTESFVFALNAGTGTETWRKTIVRNTAEGIDMAPGVHDGTVYVATVPGNATDYYTGNGQGVLWALDGRTGAAKWTWDTVPADLWGHPDINSGGGLWYPPTFDARGDVYIAVANPAPFLGTAQYPWGSSRPGPDLYTNSIVKLNGRTGKMVWYNQVLPHDVYDWDVQNPPMLATAGHRPVVIGSGKVGYVYEFDQATGRLLWKTQVGTHNGHDNDNLLALNGDTSKLPQFPITLSPGVLGGAPSPSAVDGDTVYVAVNDFPVTWNGQGDPSFADLSTGKGAIVALDLVTGRIKWQQPLATSPYGGTTVANDLVFTTTLDGTIHALNTHTGAPAWQSTLPTQTVAQVAIDGDTLVTAAGWPQDASQQAEFIAYRLGH